MSCGPCEDVECEEVSDEEALEKLYRRLFEKRDDSCLSVNDGDDHGPNAATGGCECSTQQPAAPTPRTTDGAVKKPSGATTSPDFCAHPADGGSLIKKADRQLTALLKPRRDDDDDGGGSGGGGGGGGGASSEGDNKHLINKLPGFKTCKNRKPGTVNAALLGLDLEHSWMSGMTGDGRDDRVRRAAYELAAAEALCKHAGAVEAAEKAVLYEPAVYLAEEAARFGAQSYTSPAAAQTGQDAGDNTPVVVVAYIGNRTPSAEDEQIAANDC